MPRSFSGIDSGAAETAAIPSNPVTPEADSNAPAKKGSGSSSTFAADSGRPLSSTTQFNGE